MTEPKPTEGMLEQGFSQLREGQFEDAIETFTAYHAVEAGDDRALRGRGLAYIQLKKAPQAEADFKSAWEKNTDEPENWMGYGISLAMQGKIYEAIKVYEDLLARQPKHIPGHMQLGQLHLKLGVINKARDYFNKAMTLKPNLEQRRAIEAILKEQEKLDAKRFYRPDFDRLRKQK